MKHTIICLLLAACFLQTTHSEAQTATQPGPDTVRYSMYAYMKVAPGKRDEYLKLEKAWKKIHLAQKKAGQLYDWSLSELVSPAGTNNEYDFVCRNTYIGRAALAASIDGNDMSIDWKSLLTPDEIALVNRTDEIRSMVKTEIWSSTTSVWAPDADAKAKIFVWNYFTIPEGKTRDDHDKMELDIWKPVHAARVKDGTMKGWVLLNMEFPFGASMPYEQATVDAYTSTAQLLSPWFEDYFKKVHPGKNIDDLMKQTSAACTLVKGEVRMLVDRLSW